MLIYEKYSNWKWKLKCTFLEMCCGPGYDIRLRDESRMIILLKWKVSLPILHYQTMNFLDTYKEDDSRKLMTLDCIKKSACLVLEAIYLILEIATNSLLGIRRSLIGFKATLSGFNQLWRKFSPVLDLILIWYLEPVLKQNHAGLYTR